MMLHHPTSEPPVIEKVNLAEKLARFSDRWSPKIVADVNDAQVKLAKLEGEFVWHAHAEEDELFLVLHGRLVIELRDGEVVLDAGEFAVVPRGVEHRPVAREEVHVMLVEPRATLNTGDVVDARTITELERL
jgi:mannose-6-phosphate isomerase-like protein (cupin superfamily)